MNLELNKNKNNLLFIPLGGSGEIGMNFNLYHYQGKWLIVDCGMGFAEDYFPGVTAIIPDISFLTPYKKDIVGMVITHIHEDHIGAIHHLWEELKCPIYATSFATAFLKAKLTDAENKPELAKNIKIHEVKEASKFKIAPFAIEMVPLCHSTPEMQALVIKTPVGDIFHTGDWKFDSDPLLGTINDEKLLSQYGDNGILALVGDSTNVFNSNSAGSEGELRNSLISLIEQCDKMVVVATFASNVARLESLLVAARTVGRKVVLAGRSVRRIINAAKESGYLLDHIGFVDEGEIGKYPRNKLLVISTGCQGEPLAALTKMAHATHPRIKLLPGDTVIFSSKIIPGNDKKISRVFNALCKAGIETMTERDHFVHVSGHPGRPDVERLLKLIRPKILVPVHGEYVHMHEHAKIGRGAGVPCVIEVENGDVVNLSPDQPQKIAKVQADEIAVDGNLRLKANSPIMKARRRLRDEGVIVISLVMSQNLVLKLNPIIDAPGCLDDEEDHHFIMYLQNEIKDALSQPIKVNNKDAVKETYQKIVKSLIKKIIKEEVGKTPEIKVNIRII